MKRLVLVAVGLLALAVETIVHGQAAALQFKQLTDQSTAQPLTAAERATLGDPLFNLLLRDKASTVTLSAVQAAIQPNTANRHLFVVSEDIVRKTRVGGRRTVLAFDGENGGEKLTGNLMLSVSFAASGGLPEDGAEIEAWGWDNHRERYNYYKLDVDDSGVNRWKFRGSSAGADLLAPGDRAKTCFRCHVVGAPVMKELLFPWNNWHAGVGGSFKADYLDPNSAEPSKWPAATTAPFQRLSTADKLEDNFLIPAFKRFNASRLNSVLKRDDATGNRFVSSQGRMTMLEGRRLLRPLFETMDVNLISSRNTTGVHPFGSPADFVPTLEIQIPASFFLNVNLIAGGGPIGLSGLKIIEANQFSQFAKLTQQENKELVDKFKLQVNGVQGDTHFGWFVPEAAFVESEVLDQTLKLGAVTPHFVAAALAVDLEAPVFSARRAELLKFVPDQYDFVQASADVLGPRNASDDFLTQTVVARINQASPPAGSAADEFRTLLNSPNAVAELRNRVNNYASRVKAALASANRRVELERLYSVLVARRRIMLADDVLSNLDETEGRVLLPLPKQN